MPSEPRIPAEPTLEELSAYLDHELDASTQARVADHVAGCAECKLRLDGLRETVHAVRALPMETPIRTFTIPAQRRQSFRWAPVGWVGGVAAAFLVVAFGVTQLHGPAGNTASTSRGFAEHKAAAPAASQGLTTLDSRAGAASQAFNATANTVTVVDPRQSSRMVTLSTDARSYGPNGVMTVRVQLSGFAAAEVSQPRLLLERNGYAVELATPTHGGSAVPASFEISYDLARLPLSSPVAGSYTLMLIEPLPAPASGSGSTLVARLPITIGG
ncbi:MAG: zf-HC2 domain-containing protein [Candidatus Dormibacteraeota bacterium]|nr:zf-HC2 domain-containing protein [Candidatus Dormibacteraeota bacterium]